MDMTEITVAAMNKQLEVIKELRLKEAQIGQEKKLITNQLEIEEGKMIDMLETSGLSSYKGPEGQAIISARTSVKIPRTQEDREAFFNYLKELGLYDTMIGVNSQTLNSFYKSQFEEAKERGDVDFEIPGLKEVELRKTLSFRTN